MSNDTTVNVTNIYVFQSVYESLGMGQVPPGTTPDNAVKAILEQLKKNVAQDWPGSFPPYDDSQVDMGVMQPWSDNIPGSAPQCVIDQITGDFNSWDLPNDQAMIKQMAQEITEHIGAQVGTTETFDGKKRLGGTVEIFWRVAYATGPVVDNPLTLGIFYSFCAVTSLQARQARR